MKVSVIGSRGYWAKNIIKTLQDFENIESLLLCDNTYTVLEKNNQYTDYKQAINESDITFIITPPHTHYEITKFALEKNKHVFVEKPMTLNYKHACELLSLAKEKGLILHTDNTFIYSPEIHNLKRLIDFDCFGKLNNLESIRSNWGPFNNKTGVIWDLITHDVSILNYIIPYELKGVSATGCSMFDKNTPEKAKVTFFFDKDFVAFVEVSYLSKNKSRYISIRGDKGFAWNDSAVNNSVIFEDKYKNIRILTDDFQSPLYLEINHFFECIKQKKDTLSSGYEGAYVVKILEAIDKSYLNQGSYVSMA